MHKAVHFSAFSLRAGQILVDSAVAGRGWHAPAVHGEILVGVLNALPHALILSLDAHAVGDDDPAVLQVDGGAAIVGQVAQDQQLDGVVWQVCMRRGRSISILGSLQGMLHMDMAPSTLHTFDGQACSLP